MTDIRARGVQLGMPQSNCICEAGVVGTIATATGATKCASCQRLMCSRRYAIDVFPNPVAHDAWHESVLDRGYMGWQTGMFEDILFGSNQNPPASSVELRSWAFHACPFVGARVFPNVTISRQTWL